MAALRASLQDKLKPYLGILYGLLASFLFSIMSVCAKSASYNFFLVVAVRCGIQLLLLQPAIIYLRKDILKGCQRPQVYFVMGRAIIGTIGTCCKFYAIQNMNIGDASAILFSSPLITAILAAILLKEKFTIFNLVATIVSFAGVVLVARPPFIFGTHGGESQVHFAVAGIAFIGALATSFVILTIRKIGNRVDSYTITYYNSLISFIVPLIIVPMTTHFQLPPCGNARWLLILVGVLGFLGQIAFTKAAQLEKASLVAVIRTMDVIFGYILEVIIFHSAPTLLSIFGSLLVIAGSSALGIKKWYDIKSESKHQSDSTSSHGAS